jgi:CheY-like chemotaxis protein
MVDDEPLLRMIFERWITSLGCKAVYSAADGRSALALLHTHPIDLLISDIRMPIMDGVTLVRHLSEISHPVPAIIFVSGFGDIDLREMYDLGVEAFLAKPSDRRELLTAMEKALAERSSLWLEPMHTAPRQLLVQSDDASSVTGRPSLSVGRGGFSAHVSKPLSLGKLAFDWYLDDHPCRFIGQGYVRWSSRADKSVGVEVVYLDPACRSWFVDEIARSLPRSFIPGLTT